MSNGGKLKINKEAVDSLKIMNNLQICQESLQQRFDCTICLGPKLNMVSGLCQHRICDECLYQNDDRRPCMASCPMCGMFNSFPLKKPIIPSQVIDLQRCIGIQQCPNQCPQQMWYWEIDEHLLSCPKSSVKTASPKKKSAPKPKLRNRQRRVSDLGPVSVTSRVSKDSRSKKTRSGRAHLARGRLS